MRRPAPKREGKWTELPVEVRERVERDNCQVCGEFYGVMHDLRLTRQAIDHLLSRRWLEARGIYPHVDANLLSVCARCHGLKKAIEDKFFESDLAGYLAGLRSIGYPVSQVISFALSVGLKEFGKFAYTARGQL